MLSLGGMAIGDLPICPDFVNLVTLIWMMISIMKGSIYLNGNIPTVTVLLEQLTALLEYLQVFIEFCNL